MDCLCPSPSASSTRSEITRITREYQGDRGQATPLTHGHARWGAWALHFECRVAPVVQTWSLVCGEVYLTLLTLPP